MKKPLFLLSVFILLLTAVASFGSDGDELFRLIEAANHNDTKMLDTHAFNKEESRKGWEKVNVFLQSKSLDELLSISMQIAVIAANRPHLENEWDKGDSASSFVWTALSPLMSRKLGRNDYLRIFAEMKKENVNPYWLEGISGWIRNFVLKGRLTKETQAFVLKLAYDSFNTILTKDRKQLTQRQKEAVMVIWLELLSNTFMKEVRDKTVQEIVKAHPDDLRTALHEVRDRIDKDSLAIMLADLSNAPIALDVLEKLFSTDEKGLESVTIRHILSVMQRLSLFDKASEEKCRTLMKELAQGR